MRLYKKLIERVPEIVVNLVTAFIENAPKLVEHPMKDNAVGRGAYKYLPNLLKVPQEIVKGLVDKFISRLVSFQSRQESGFHKLKHL